MLLGRLVDLDRRLRDLQSVVVAFSGGADSAFLLAASARSLGATRVVAATAVSPSLPAAELDQAREFARGLGVRHLTPATDEMSRRGVRRQRPRPLLPLQGRAARRARTAGVGARHARGGNRHQRRRRARGLPARHPGRSTGGCCHAAARGRVDQATGPRSLTLVGPGHRGQAGGRLSVQPGRLRHRDRAGPARQDRTGRGRPAAGDDRRRPGRARTSGSATSATAPGSRSTGTWSTSWYDAPTCSERSPGSTTSRSTPAGSGPDR